MILVFPVEVDAEKVAAAIGSVEPRNGRRRGQCVGRSGRREEASRVPDSCPWRRRKTRGIYANKAPSRPSQVTSPSRVPAVMPHGMTCPSARLGVEGLIVAKPDVEHALHVEGAAVFGIEAGREREGPFRADIS